MSGATDTGDSYTTTEGGDGDVTYVIGITFAMLFLLITLSYASYKCNRNMRNSPSSTNHLNHPNHPNHQVRTVSRGVEDNVHVTLPSFVYSEDMMREDGNDNFKGSGCSICLAGYKPKDIVRILPECGHLFHVNCIDTWLKVHASCPVCRNSPLPDKLWVQRR